MLQLHDTVKDGRLSFDEFKAIFNEERGMNLSDLRRDAGESDTVANTVNILNNKAAESKTDKEQDNDNV